MGERSSQSYSSMQMSMRGKRSGTMTIRVMRGIKGGMRGMKGSMRGMRV